MAKAQYHLGAARAAQDQCRRVGIEMVRAEHRRAPAGGAAGSGLGQVDREQVGEGARGLVAVEAARGHEVGPVLDRFLVAGICREEFDTHLAAGRIAVAGERITDAQARALGSSPTFTPRDAPSRRWAPIVARNPGSCAG